jgi:chromosome partitioning protein
MFTVTIATEKGGVGKTTLTTNLAVQALLAGKRVALLDADQLASLTKWRIKRVKESGKEDLVVDVANNEEKPQDLRDAVQSAREDGFDWLFIDTGAGVSLLPAVAIELADLVLLPCVPTEHNMDGMEETAEAIKKQGKPGFFVINRGRSKAMNDSCAVALTGEYGLPAVPTHRSHRWPIGDAEGMGLGLAEIISRDPSVERGKEEFRALWNWVVAQRDKLAAQPAEARRRAV